MALTSLLKDIFRRFGLEIGPYDLVFHPVERRMQLINFYQVDMIFDVGANRGQFVKEMRAHGYPGKVVSFEPMSGAYAELVQALRADRLWKGMQIALGDREGEAEINISGNSFSSSLLDLLPRHTQTAPASKYIGKEKIAIKRLDSLMPALYADKSLYLKIDTQGFEYAVLQGATNTLRNFAVGVQLELSAVPLYKDQKLFIEICQYLSSYGFTLMSIEPGFSDPKTGQLLQFDGIFFKTMA